MKMLQAFLLGVILLVGCNRVLSKRTDEQAWLEFDQDNRSSSRAPAAASDNLLKESLSVVPVRKILMKCGTQASNQACYQSALVLQFDEVFRRVDREHPEAKFDYRREQKEFFALRSFEHVSDEVNRFHQSIFSGIEFKAREQADELFSRCENEKKSEVAIDRFDLFTGGTTVMPKAVYACLVSKWLSNEDRLLQETADRLGLTIVSDEAKQWIKGRQIASIFEQEVSENARKRAKLERETFEKEKKELFKDFDSSQGDETAIREWAPKLREKFAWSPVEQWIIEWKKL